MRPNVDIGDETEDKLDMYISEQLADYQIPPKIFTPEKTSEIGNEKVPQKKLKMFVRSLPEQDQVNMRKNFKENDPKDLQHIKIKNLDQNVQSEIVFGPEFATQSFLLDKSTASPEKKEGKI